MCYILSSSDSSSSFKDSYLKQIDEKNSLMAVLQLAGNKQRELCCRFTILSICTKVGIQQASSYF